MNVEDWFKNKDYAIGVQLYASLPKCSRHILARLQRSKTPKNVATLKYELNKYRSSSVVISPGPVIQKKSIPTPAVVNLKQQQIQQAVVSANQKVTMAMLPIPSLRKRFVEKNNAFYQYCELKYQLNDLGYLKDEKGNILLDEEGNGIYKKETPEDEAKALEIILEIHRLNNLIDEIWREIDYYLEHHKQLPSANDYTSLNYKEQSKKLQLLYQRRTKRTASLNGWKKELQEMDTEDIKFKKLQAKIGRKTQELQQIEIDINILKKLTNE